MAKAGGSGKGKASTKGLSAQEPSHKALQDILKQHQVKNSTKFLECLASIGIRVPKEHKGKGKGKGATKGNTKPTLPQGQNQSQAKGKAKGRGRERSQNNIRVVADSRSLFMLVHQD